MDRVEYQMMERLLNRVERLADSIEGLTAELAAGRAEKATEEASPTDTVGRVAPWELP